MGLGLGTKCSWTEKQTAQKCCLPGRVHTNGAISRRANEKRKHDNPTVGNESARTRFKSARLKTTPPTLVEYVELKEKNLVTEKHALKAATSRPVKKMLSRKNQTSTAC